MSDIEDLWVIRYEALTLNGVWESARKEMEDEILNITHRHNVDAILVNLECRRTRLDTDNTSPILSTFRICAHRHDLSETRSWATAVQSVLSFVRKIGFEDVNVEIYDNRAQSAKRDFPLKATDGLCQQWSVIREEILAILGSEDWVTLNCF